MDTILLRPYDQFELPATPEGREFNEHDIPDNRVCCLTIIRLL